MDNGKAVLEDLDIAVPIECVVTSGPDALNGVSGDTPLRQCSDEEVATRQKRNIAHDAGSWDTLSIPYTIDWDAFSKWKVFFRQLYV